MPDMDEGFLLSRAVSTALVAPVPGPDPRVCGVWVETRPNSGQVLWLLLPAHCCAALGLQPKPGHPILEVQFQNDPLPFHLWHQAVDALPEESLVVPDLSACTLPCPGPVSPTLQGDRRQKQAVAVILGTSPGVGAACCPSARLWPLWHGQDLHAGHGLPGGRLPAARKVLLCTRTDRAADTYAAEYFHPYVSSGHPEAAPLWVVHTDCPPSLTDAATLRYCCLTEDHQAFRLPTWAKLERHHIVLASTSWTRQLGVPIGFFSHILIDQASQMLEWETLTPLRYAAPGTRVVLAGSHVQGTPGSSVWPGAGADVLRHRLLEHHRQQTLQVAQRSCTILYKNYRSTQTVVRFVSDHVSLASGHSIQASGKIPGHPGGTRSSSAAWRAAPVRRLHDVLAECSRGSSGCREVSAMRQELRKRDLGQVSVGSFENLPGCFTDACVLSTVMTHTQAQVVAVGDAVALCSLEACSKLWGSFLRECVEHGAVCPEGLSLEQIQKQSWASCWQPAAQETERELSSNEPRPQQLLDHSRDVTVTVQEDGLLDSFARPLSPPPAWQYVNLPEAKQQKLLHKWPQQHCCHAFLRESLRELKGRLHCGMAFPGDEALVQVLGWARWPQGRVLSIHQREHRQLAFVCHVDEWEPCVMTPIDGSATKVLVAGLQDPLQVPVHRLLQGCVQRVGHEPLSVEAWHHRLFWVCVLLWRERFYYPLGVQKVLPEATTWEQSPDLGPGLQAEGASPHPASVREALHRHHAELSRAPSCLEGCRSFLAFATDTRSPATWTAPSAPGPGPHV
ncbi:Helicase with zinc finger domain 2 [Camelus dromedarius]|uniref:Helicase with zinc finger domain 2 n=1 Tax=Camelus dromedarius TaxID=9838 RepID=A0A5N4CVD7_CAMDR|nr:Helicase with zinc finger domain 2 [Camelus dromedarius]